MKSAIVDVEERFASWEALLRKEKYGQLIPSLEEGAAVDVAEFFAGLDDNRLLNLFEAIQKPFKVAVFEELSQDKQLTIYRALIKRKIAPVIEKLSSDLRADFYLALDEQERLELLPFLDNKVRRNMLDLSLYPADEAGGMMSTDFVMVKEEATVGDALGEVRRSAPSKKTFYAIYMVDSDMKLRGMVEIRDLMVADPTTPLAVLADTKPFHLGVHDDQEVVAHAMEKYDLVMLPILNKEGQLMGVINYDDAMRVLRGGEEKAMGTMEVFMGISTSPHEEHYLRTSSHEHYKQRILWVVGLFFACAVSSLLLHHYENILKVLPFIAFYIPTISDTGGNVGSQSATVVVRALALGEVTVQNWVFILKKELGVAWRAALTLFVGSFMKVLVLFYIFKTELTPKEGTYPCFLHLLNILGFAVEGYDTDTYGVIVAFTISLAIALQVIASTFIGASLPLLMKYWGKDPALAASPAITTIVDMVGMFIYLGLATFFLLPIG